MAATLLGSAVPPLLWPSQVLSLALSQSSGATEAPVSTGFSQGDSAGVLGKLNRLLAELAYAQVGGGNGFGIMDGLALSVSSGLTLAIASGHASIFGTVEYAGGTTVLPNNTSRCWIWLLQNGTITVLTSTTTPGSAAVLLGSCITSAGVISDLDTSGVPYIRGGNVWRETADADAPSDTPSTSHFFITKTAGGIYTWDGSVYAETIYGGRARVSSLRTKNQAGDPGVPSGEVVLYAKGDKLYFRDSTGLRQISEAGKLVLEHPTMRGNIAWPVNTETITATKQLIATDNNVQVLTASGANRNVDMPDPTTVTAGYEWRIINGGSSNNVVVRSYGGGTTIATLTPGQAVTVRPVFSAGSLSWPTAALTPES